MSLKKTLAKSTTNRLRKSLDTRGSGRVEILGELDGDEEEDAEDAGNYS